MCKECKGASICEHQRFKSICKECKGVSICEHQRIRSQCKDCHGSGICQHDKNKYKCKDCRELKKEACEGLLLIAETAPTSALTSAPTSAAGAPGTVCPACATPMGEGGMADALCSACERAKRARAGEGV